ncbi:MAG: hypothetical protein FWE46_03245 [Coriobacteriia bacterium]|nr:hypothetical protein [Coriobacteriia bacterium]MCL2537680.1 hypothetical protein [Coriobacteriia bacterium]
MMCKEMILFIRPREVNLRRLLGGFALALMVAALFCLALALPAGAKYGGFSPINPSNANLGYIAFEDAKTLMNANSVATSLQNSAHGGYITTTTKCAVCHSVHRASGVWADDATAGRWNAASGKFNHYYLNFGTGGCDGCHVGQGAQASATQVEWSGSGGPHSYPNRGCTACHKGGIHGGNKSEFWVNNVFMLGKDNDAAIKGDLSKLARGNETFYVDPDLTGGDNLNYNTYNAATTTTPVQSTRNPGSGLGQGNAWWRDGATRPMGIGAVPTGVSAPSYSAARSVATSYTCTKSGCHTNTVMANLQWGVGFSRDANNTGSMSMVTGHVLPALGTTSGTTGSACGPCHPGAFAGFPSAAVMGTSNASRRAYGCDQCHDMIGVATNSTAFPHGNRNIRVYEWVVSDTGQTQVETTIAAGNLWMYGGNIALRAGGTAGNTAGSFSHFADANWRVLRNVTGGSTGIPASGGLTDGACLKCHIAVDPISLISNETTATTGAATRSGHNSPGGYTGSGNRSMRIWLYR